MNCFETNRSCANGHNGNLVYLTKVFFDGQENSSPMMTSLTTKPGAFTQQLSIGGPVSRGCAPFGGCGMETGCGPFGGCGAETGCSNVCDPCRACNICCCISDSYNISVSANTTFDVTNAYVITHSFNMTNPTLPADLAVTVDGTAITNVEESGGQYIGDISGIMAEISKCPCGTPCASICPGHFVMASATGPWSLMATIVLEGTVYDGGQACQFKLCFQTVEGTPIVVTGASAFALCGVEIPCQIGGISPSLQMDFGACASILNPALTAGADGEITLTGSLVVTPQLHLRVTRQSLFDLSAKEICLPCDDLGQCSACDPAERACLGDASNCCCGQTTPNRVDDILSLADAGCGCNYTGGAKSAGCGCGQQSGFDAGCGCGQQSAPTPQPRPAFGTPAGIACQCCDTNGYSF